MSEKCIFCEIVAGRIPAKIVNETERTVTFLDINPVARGHSLVVAKNHFDDVSETDEEVLKEMIVVAKAMGTRIKSKLGATGYNIFNASGEDAQQSVSHVHFHIVPRYKNDSLNLWFDTENIGTSDHDRLQMQLEEG